MLTFTEKDHTYTSVDIFDETKWVSASRLAGMFRESFNAPEQALKSSQKKSSKWYGISPKEILDIWQTENVRSTTLGNWYHKKEESALIEKETEFIYNKELPIFRPVWDNGIKLAPEQKLVDGIYPEHLTFLQSVGACGQFDKIIVCEGYVHNHDLKSNKVLKKPAFTNWEGITKKMLPPLLHLDDCKLVEYALQLSIGVYMILRHNPHLKAGDLILNHCTFEIESEDKYGYPILKLENGEPILKGVEQIKVPYMKREVELMFEFLKRRPKNV